MSCSYPGTISCIADVVEYALFIISYTGLYTYTGIRCGLFDGGIDGKLVIVGIDEI